MSESAPEQLVSQPIREVPDAPAAVGVGVEIDEHAVTSFLEDDDPESLVGDEVDA